MVTFVIQAGDAITQTIQVFGGLKRVLNRIQIHKLTFAYHQI